MRLEAPNSLSLAADKTKPAWDLISCPVCGSIGKLYGSHWGCLTCGRSYQRYSRIVDFRVVAGREDLSFAHLQAARAEKDRVTRALEMAASASFAEMVDAYFKEFPTCPEIERGEKGTLLHAEEIAREVLIQMSQSVPFADLAGREESVALDVGCGGAGLTGLLATKFSAVIAMDADMDRMVLAERHCAELGLNNIVLICAFGETMPLTLDAVDFISCVEVLEHATSQPQLISEFQRILRHGGKLYLTTPNRFSAGREPHVNLWALGWLPRWLMDPYVRSRLGVPYLGKRNLSYWELSRIMKVSFGTNFRFTRPRRTRYTAQARVANSFLRIPGLAHLVRPIVAGFHVVCSKD